MPSTTIDAGGRLLQPVQAAQQGRLARARRADDEHQLALGHHQVDALQDVKGAEMLVDAARLDDGRRGSARRPSGCGIGAVTCRRRVGVGS